MSFSCVLCGQPIPDSDIRRALIAKQVMGWQLPRGGGGLNTLYEKRETGAIAHVTCVKYGRPARPDQSYEQPELWNE